MMTVASRWAIAFLVSGISSAGFGAWECSRAAAAARTAAASMARVTHRYALCKAGCGVGRCRTRDGEDGVGRNGRADCVVPARRAFPHDARASRGRLRSSIAR